MLQSHFPEESGFQRSSEGVEWLLTLSPGYTPWGAGFWPHLVWAAGLWLTREVTSICPGPAPLQQEPFHAQTHSRQKPN